MLQCRFGNVAGKGTFDFPLRREEKTTGERKHLIAQANLTGRVSANGVGHMVLLDELLDAILFTLHRYTNHGEPTALVLVVHTNQGRSLNFTGATPRRPKIHQYHFALIVRQLEGFSIDGGQGKIVISI